MKQKYERPKIPIIKSHSDFELVGKNDDADFAIQRIGNNAGLFRPKDVMMNYSDQSHYFIRSKISPIITENIFKRIDFSIVKYNTAGNPSISPSELYQLYDKHKEILKNDGSE